MENLNVNIQDIIDTIQEDAKDSEIADLLSASIDVIQAASKLIGLYKDYYSKGARKIRYNGESHTIGEWSELVGIPEKTLRKRITQNHWDIADALTTPVTNSKAQRNFHQTVTVLQYNYKRELVREFKSIREAARQLGIDYQMVNKAIEGQDPMEQVAKYGFYLQTPKKSDRKDTEDSMTA